MTHDEKPCVAEQYTSALSTTNLRVQLDRRTSADVLIASGMSNSRTGAALMRLVTEYGSAARNETDQKLMMMRLTSLPVVLAQVTWQANHWGIERAEQAALAVVANWLDSTCKACHGRGRETIPGTPSLSNRPCKVCGGVGKMPIPYGSAGEKLNGYILDCLSRWKQSTSKVLHGTRN